MKKLHLFILALFCVTALHAADRIAVAEIMTRGNIDAAGLAGLADQPEALRWRCGGRVCLIDRLELQGAGEGAQLAVAVRNLPAAPGMPGGVNSFSPHSTSQVRFEIVPSTQDRIWRLRCRLSFLPAE